MSDCWQSVCFTPALISLTLQEGGTQQGAGPRVKMKSFLHFSVTSSPGLFRLYSVELSYSQVSSAK